MESVSELESVSSMMPSTLEELRERVSAREPSALERVTTLLGRWIIRIVSIIEPLSQFRIREDLVCLINGGHLGL